MAEGEEHRWKAREDDRAGAGGLRLASTPMIRQCLQALQEKPDTTEGLMERLGWDRAKVHYALSVLRDRGFVE